MWQYTGDGVCDLPRSTHPKNIANIKNAERNMFRGSPERGAGLLAGARLAARGGGEANARRPTSAIQPVEAVEVTSSG